MIEFATLATFVPGVLAIIVAPGPDTVYTVTQSLKSGRSAGLITGFGTATGVLVHTTAAILGLAALLRTSALAYLVVKYVGAAYLLYLGVQMFRSDDQFDLQTDLARRVLSKGGRHQRL
ncbi:arginine exporter protein ArgO [Halalkalicoccus paucihalophilus]|uniref:Arginine exporter protein ArgO n=1 Tax=Halalkalicoccus paucihalophilus TaxID=1008153 RepID=A0A151AA55_9EURY|nr:LysE family translocator [Halalkalicoccus paucihalophilus]KYH24247.1 arginine exporter protein ArgO [Halalkalicoccus paucihalophilus]